MCCVLGESCSEYDHDCSTTQAAAKASEKARGLAELIRQELERRTDGEPA